MRKPELVILVAKGVQDEEFLYPYYRAQEDCHVTVYAAGEVLKDKKGDYVPGKYGVPCRVNYHTTGLNYLEIDNIHEQFVMPEAVIIPGGLECPEILRQDKQVLRFLQLMHSHRKIIGAICHGPQVLISAGLLDKKRATCFPGMKDDLKNASAIYVEEDLVIDENIITSPHYKHNTKFVRAVLEQVKWKQVV